MRRASRSWGIGFALFAIACSQGSGPKGILNRFLDTSLQGRYAEAYVFVSSLDRDIKSEQEFEAESVRDPLGQVLASRTSYTIDSVSEDGAKAQAQVTLKEPDLETIRKALFPEGAGPPEDWTVEAARTLVDEKFKDTPLPVVSRGQSYDLVKEPAGWRLFFDWEKSQKLVELFAQAATFEASGNVTLARKKYAEILELDPSNADAVAKQLELDAKLHQAEEMNAYLPNVKLVGETEVSTTAKGYLALFGEIRNDGARSLDLVEIAVTFLDASGAHIGEPRRYKVVAPAGSGGATDGPLPAATARKFGIPLPNAPAGWSRNSVVQVANLEFSK